MALYPVFVDEIEAPRLRLGESVTWQILFAPSRSDMQDDDWWLPEWLVTFDEGQIEVGDDQHFPWSVRRGQLTAIANNLGGRYPTPMPLPIRGLLHYDELTPPIPWPDTTGVIRRIVAVARRLRRVPEGGWESIPGDFQWADVEDKYAAPSWEDRPRDPKLVSSPRTKGWIAWLDVTE